HVDTLLAMMMQESGGRGEDPMQSSESYCGEIGCIDNPEKSIDQGVKYFAESLEAANGDVRLAVQSYNFGKGFSNYVREQETTSSQEITIEFSQDMYAKAEDKPAYLRLEEEATEFDADDGVVDEYRDD